MFEPEEDGLSNINGIAALLWLAGTFGVLGATVARALNGGVDPPTTIAVTCISVGLLVQLFVVVVRRTRARPRDQAWKGRRDVN